MACGSRGGDHTFKYSIDTTPPTTGTTKTTTVEFNEILIPCTTYEFKVQASTSAGDGPEASIRASTNDRGT